MGEGVVGVHIGCLDVRQRSPLQPHNAGTLQD